MNFRTRNSPPLFWPIFRSWGGIRWGSTVIGFKDGKNISNLDKQRLKIIQWVANLWWDDKKKKENSIINSFYKTTITFPLDGSKDNEYEFPEEVLEQQ